MPASDGGPGSQEGATHATLLQCTSPLRARVWDDVNSCEWLGGLV